MIQTPSQVKRKVAIEFDASIPRHWFNNDAFLSRYFDSFSMAFPVLERFMIEVVREVTASLDDEDPVKQEAKAFIFQEAQHSIVHDRYNQLILAQGAKAPKMDRFLNWSVQWMNSHLSLKSRVAVGAGIEHFTSLMADHFIASGLFAPAHPKMRALWEWHALEELEHKNVLFDVYKNGCKGGYFRRTVIFVCGVFYANYLSINYAKELLESEGAPTGRFFFSKSLRRLFGKRGVLRSMVGPIFYYFKPGFHPDTIAEPPLMKHWAQAYEQTQDALSASLYINAHYRDQKAA